MENKEKQLELQETARKLKNQYYKEWRKQNPEKSAEYNKNYWERKALEKLEGVNAKN